MSRKWSITCFISSLANLSLAWAMTFSLVGGGAHLIEGITGMGQNLVPWQLGMRGWTPYDPQSRLKQFASVYELFALRRITIPRDFFHAMFGLLDVGLAEAQLSADGQEAMLSIARACIQRGDYSPLFMIPPGPLSCKDHPGAHTIQRYGYYELGIFNLGPLESPAVSGRLALRRGNAVVQAEEVGVLRELRSSAGPQPFQGLAKLAVGVTGWDKTEAFVQTVGARFFGQDWKAIFGRLSEGNRMAIFEHCTCRIFYYMLYRSRASGRDKSFHSILFHSLQVRNEYKFHRSPWTLLFRRQIRIIKGSTNRILCKAMYRLLKT